MNKLKKIFLLTAVSALVLSGCGNTKDESAAVKSGESIAGATNIMLSDSGVTVEGEAVSENQEDAVYVAKDIVFYLADQGFTYGEGTAADEHTQEEADKNTVVHITQPGTYAVSGKLSAGQIAVDLGEDAQENPEAVVTLILNGVDITCEVAPAVIFYNVYECNTFDEDTATYTVDTTAAGANVQIADDSVNQINGSYVARIYKSYTLSEDGTEVVDNKKLHKYDGAFYSKMSMNVNGGEKGNGVLNIQAENEGLDSEMHLTVNGGIININSGNDGINTNEDGISVTTINGGSLNINVNGSTGEGDGIDSNGWLVINGGTVTAAACGKSGDAGIDSDMGIYLNGGTVVASGNMFDKIAGGEQSYVVFTFAQTQTGGTTYAMKDADSKTVAEWTPANNFQYLVVADDNLTAGTYTMWKGSTQLTGSSDMKGGMGFGGGQKPEGSQMPEGMELPEGGQMPEGMELPEGAEVPEGMELPEGAEVPEGMELPEGAEMPEGMERPEGGQMPEGMELPEGAEMPEGMELPEGAEVPEGMERPEGGQMPEGMEGGRGGFGGRGNDKQGNMGSSQLSEEFVISEGANYFTNIQEKEAE